jgi:hypothetical protein
MYFEIFSSKRLLIASSDIVIRRRKNLLTNELMMMVMIMINLKKTNSFSLKKIYRNKKTNKIPIYLFESDIIIFSFYNRVKLTYQPKQRNKGIILYPLS